MENNPKKSKALIITIIVIILLIIAGYLIFKNRDVFGVKTSASITKIFSPLISSKNSTDLNKIDENSTKALAQAGEDIKKGDSVSVFGTGANSNGNPIVVKSGSKGSNSSVFGFANQDITNGNIGEFTIKSGGSNNFFKSFSSFMGGIFKPTPIVPPPSLCENGATNFPDCTTIGDKCMNGKTNPPLCTVDNSCLNGADNPPDCNTLGGKCLNFANNPPLCTIIPGGLCKNGAINPPECTIIPGGGPDLRAGNVTPTSTTINTPTTLYSMITNDGGDGTIHSFSSFFAITITGKTNVELSVVIPTLEAKTANEAKILYSFSSAGIYSIRACADKKSGNDAGTVTESNENNNCGSWTTFTVTNSLPTTGDGDITPPPITPPKDITTPPAIEVNKCLVIEQNPLTFTPEEKARLAVLLRKFYLISSTLKTTEDITTIYNEIEQQKNFITQIEDLTKQCYCQVNGIASLGQVGCKNLMMENPSWAQHGNPWYEKTSGGSFPYTNENSGYLNPASIDDANTERILNIW